MRKIQISLIVAMLLMVRPVLSYADWNGHGGGAWHGGGHGGGWHNHSYIGLNFSVWPDSYYYAAPYYPPEDAVLVSPPEVGVPQPEVIEAPSVTDNQTQITTLPSPSTADNSLDSITINIPNDKGSYTAVTLKRSGNGFIGPQGEFYAQFPTVAVLKVMYGK